MKPGGRFFYGWVIVGVSFVVMIVAYGVWWSFPIFFVSILDEFGWSRAGAASIFTVGSVVYAFSSFVAGVVFDRLGPRLLIPVAGVLIAIGCVISSVSGSPVGITFCTKIFKCGLTWYY